MNAGPITQTFVSTQPRTFSGQIRALLLTDVVDSTKLSEQLGDDAMASVWEEHDRVARDLLPPHQGREIDKTDGMLLLFDDAASATNYAMAYHVALAAMQTPLKARAGLHVGSVILRENNADDIARGAKPLEVDGLAKPTAARVMSLAIGGQTLLTPEAKDNLGETELKLQSHGHWVMKGVSEPVELFEAGAQDARFVAPTDSDKVYRVIKVNDTWLPVKEIPNNLPAQGTSFVGREKELEDIKALLGSARLVTLLGMGGLGKTRLSLQAATEMMHQFPDGVWFLDLSPITDPALALAEAAQVLGVREEPDRPLLQTVCAHLKNKRLLMVFDNCEHLIRASADLAHAVIKAAPLVRLAASSREALRIPGERAYPILPLPVPKVGDTLAVLRQSTAVRLFVARAQAHKPSFDLDEDNAAAVAELVARLEGIPLALELAAARVRALSIPDINKRLNDRYKLLTGGARVHQERQQTLRALVDWSYDMLNEPEKTLLNRLAVFKGGWDMEAAEAVCGTDPLDPMDVLETLTSLVEKSLVMLDESGDETRYKMLETIRDYAREKLSESGELYAVVAVHCNYFFAFAKTAKVGYKGAKSGYWLKRTEGDVDNLRAAINSALSDLVDARIAVKLAVALQSFWKLRGYIGEGAKFIDQMLAHPTIAGDAIPRAHALYVGATLAISQGEYVRARDMFDLGLRLRREIGNQQDIATTLSTYSRTELECGNSNHAKALEAEAFGLFEKLGLKDAMAIGFLLQGEIEMFNENDAVALDCFLKAASLAKQIQYREIERSAECWQGIISFHANNYGKSKQHFSKSLETCIDTEDREGTAIALHWLGVADMKLGDLDAAFRQLLQSLAALSAFELRVQVLECLYSIALLAQQSNFTHHAIQITSAVCTSRERMGYTWPPRDLFAHDLWLAQLHAAAEEPVFATQWAIGSDMDVKSAVKLALSIKPALN